MNHQLGNMETPHNQTTCNQTTQSKRKNKVKFQKFKDSYEQWKDYLT